PPATTLSTAHKHASYKTHPVRTENGTTRQPRDRSWSNKTALSIPPLSNSPVCGWFKSSRMIKWSTVLGANSSLQLLFLHNSRHKRHLNRGRIFRKGFLNGGI